ncbi:DNA-directed RNA polymerase subunit beta' [Streptomyces sp. OM5714]|nr:DNA-directed RNA polymerase subunit beta' [Streptomyces sp. OM5714]
MSKPLHQPGRSPVRLQAGLRISSCTALGAAARISGPCAHCCCGRSLRLAPRVVPARADDITGLVPARGDLPPRRPPAVPPLRAARAGACPGWSSGGSLGEPQSGPVGGFAPRSERLSEKLFWIQPSSGRAVRKADESMSAPSRPYPLVGAPGGVGTRDGEPLMQGLRNAANVC